METGMIPAKRAWDNAFTFSSSFNRQHLLALLFLSYGVAGGMFIVPLNSLIQFNAKDKELGKVLAGK